MAGAVRVLAEIPDVEELSCGNEFRVAVAEVSTGSLVSVIVAGIGPVIVKIVGSVIWIGGIVVPVHNQKKSRRTRFRSDIGRIFLDGLSQNLLLGFFSAVPVGSILG